MSEKLNVSHPLKHQFQQPLEASLFGTYHSMNLFRSRRLFVVKFNSLPHLICEHHIDAEKFKEEFTSVYGAEIYEDYYGKSGSRNQSLKTVDYYCFLKEDLLVHIDFDSHEITLLYHQTSEQEIMEIHTLILQCRKVVKKEPKINVVVSSQQGLLLHLMDLKATKLRISDYYNDDFLPVHEHILSRLKKEKDKGLVLLHGKPGTGKTTYIKYLISQVEKDVIFMPPSLASQITNPGLLELLIENPNSILVIEDAEDIILDRNHRGNSAVSALLNLSDGILAECLNVQIICSFNTELSKIDSALLRKGRLIARYEFKALTTAKANHLLAELEVAHEFFEPQTLADVFNYTEKSNRQPQKKIGFLS